MVGIGQFAEHWRDDQGGERMAKGERDDLTQDDQVIAGG